ncbi:GGDEF domain-containing protein [Mesorhizobium sp. CAU 1741]|uniref:GGDEF domain-containing protein n=1 Tax=Mesorhizobium sp. CAU 1741 TaxID=3140366 RepID=UPI00325A518C
MRQILLKAAVLAIGSAAASFLIVITIVPAIGGVVEGNAVLMTLVCPLVIAFPASAYTLWQKQKLADAFGQLAAAHEQLADAHMELAEAHEKLAEKARHDDMTRLLNRESFFAALKNSRRRTDTGVLLIIDADNFKYINDTHGHQQGDAALLLIADAIRAGVRDADLVGRIGGEEFAVFLGGTTAEEAMLVAERVRLGVEAIPFSPGEGKFLPLSVSIGAARLRPHLSWSQLMREADRRLYEAKRQGRNRVVFENGSQKAA